MFIFNIKINSKNIVKTAFIIATGMKTKKMDAKTMTVQTMKNTRQAAGAATGGENGHEGKRHRS